MALSLSRPKASSTEAAATKFDVPTDNDDLIVWLERKREMGRARIPELQMKMNLAYVLGEQWAMWDQVRREWVRPQNDPNDPNPPVRITVNKIAGILERAISKLTKSSPIPECRPVSDEDDDVGAAKVGSRVLDSEMNRMGWEQFLTSFYFWVGTLGWSYVHLYWDPKAGKSVGTAESAPGVSVDLNEGQITAEMVPAFELGVDPNRQSMADAKWATRTTSMTREGVYERWGVMPEGAQPGRDLADEVQNLMQRSGTPKNNSEWIFVHQFWLVPGSRIKPEGMVITWSGKTILEGPKPFPYDHGRLPFVQFNLLPGIGTPEGRTWVNDMLPIQTDYNDARSREAEIRRQLSPKVLSPMGAIDTKRLTSRVEVVEYNPVGQPPTMMIPDSGWMSQYEEGMKRADMEMGERAGQQDVSSGRAPSASMPAAAILALQEADDTKLAISAKELAQGLQEIGWQILMLARQYWKEPRIIRTWSESGDLDVQRFIGADIDNQLDVHVSTESAMPRSKTARAQLAIELWNSPKPVFSDPRMLVRMIDMPGTDMLIETLDLDAKQQQRELGLLVKGVDTPVHDWDNHMVHMTEVNNYRKSGEYEKKPPEIRAVIDAHYAAHAELMLAQQGIPNGIGPGPEPGHDGLGVTGGAHTAKLGGNDPKYTDTTTGAPSNPLDRASGAAPPADQEQPGAVPGISTDQLQAQTGN